MRWLLLAVVLLSGAPASAAGIPSEADWASAKQRIKLPDGGPSLAYVEMGDPSGAPLVLIHGYTDNSRSWSLLAPHLAPSERRIIALDLRGHGASDAPACCYGVDSLAHDVDGLMGALGIAHADVVGHSLGSMTALTLAALYPERVDHLVLISSSVRADAGPGSWLWDNIEPLEFPLDPDSQFMRDWYWNPNPVPADFIDRERAESAAVPAQVWLGVLRGLAVADLTAIAPLVTQPTLVLWGDQDGLFDASHQDRLRAALPNARYETFAGFGHNMFWETPERVANVIDGFLGD